MRVIITGATGFVGQHLTRRLLERGDTVIALSRNPGKARQALDAIAGAQGGLTALGWDPYEPGRWQESFSEADAVVHLAGEPVAQRWTESVKRRIHKSRVESTERIVEALGKANPRPRTFICASAIGYYGDRPNGDPLDEEAPPGRDFLADVVVQWEGAARAALRHDIRTVLMRTGIVLDAGGGALQEMMLPFKMFMGGPIGSGDQVVSWIHREDLIRLFMLALDNPRAEGPMNATAPCPVSNRILSEAIGKAMGRSSWFRVPEFALRLKLGQATQAVVSGQRVVPTAAERLGYRFEYQTIDAALSQILS